MFSRHIFHTHRHSHHSIIHYPHLHGLWGMYLNELFRRIATSLVGLFIPIYIWQLTGQVVYVPLYYAVFGFISLLFEYPGAKLIHWLGMDKAMALGGFFRLIFIYSLIFAQDHYSFIWISAICFALAQPFEWIPYHYMITKVTHKDHLIGSAASWSTFMTTIGAATGPLLGGLIITLFGFTWLYLIAGVFVLVSAAMPFLDDYQAHGHRLKWKQVKKELQAGDFWLHFRTFSLWQCSDLTYLVVWPLFLFWYFQNYQTPGFVVTVSLLLTAVLLYVLAKKVNRHDFRSIKVGSMVMSLSWWMRAFFQFPFGFVLTEIVYNIAMTLTWTPLNALYYSYGGNHRPLKFWLVHEMVWYLAVTIISLLLALILSFTTHFVWLFIFIGVLSLLIWLVPHWYHRYIEELEKS